MRCHSETLQGPAEASSCAEVLSVGIFFFPPQHALWETGVTSQVISDCEPHPSSESPWVRWGGDVRKDWVLFSLALLGGSTEPRDRDATQPQVCRGGYTLRAGT